MRLQSESPPDAMHRRGSSVIFLAMVLRLQCVAPLGEYDRDSSTLSHRRLLGSRRPEGSWFAIRIAEILEAGCQPSKSAVHRSSAASLANAMQLQFRDEPLVNIFMRE